MAGEVPLVIYAARGVCAEIVATNAKHTAILCFRSLQWRCITTIRVMRLRQSKRQCVIDIVAGIGIHNHDLLGVDIVTLVVEIASSTHIASLLPESHGRGILYQNSKRYLPDPRARKEVGFQQGSSF